jgi:uncharacterized heparinase superfamily protein
LNNTPMIVDPGTYAYTFDPHARQEFRSTRAHNTSMIDGREIADFDGMWSVKNDTTAPKVIQWNSNATQDLLIAEHYGYRRLAQPVTHRRSFTLNKSNSAIQIRDEFLGNGKHVLEWRLCLAPSVVVQLPGESEAVIKNGPVVLTVRKDGGRWKMEDGWYSPSYGVRQRTRVLSCTLSTSVPFSSEITITPNESSAK